MQATADKSFDDFDFVDLAQEFLRRNLVYQAQFVSLSKKGAIPDLTAQNFRKMAQSWGLEFRVSTRIFPTHASGNLARI